MALPDLADLDAWLAAQEAGVPALRADCAKQVRWAGHVGQATDWSVVYIHGFSASLHELRPLPDLVADGLGANLFYTRLAGHGQDGAAMGRASLQDWMADVMQAFAIGQMLGRRVLVIGCSTGCTLATMALIAGQKPAGVVMISPNFALANRNAQRLLDLPFARYWGPWIVGRERAYDDQGPLHAAYWTTRYPTRALFAMGEAVRAVRRADLGRLSVPAFVAQNEADQVVSAAATHKTMARWGGPVTRISPVTGPGEDAMAHLIAGDVFSPAQTAPLARRILDWSQDLMPD